MWGRLGDPLDEVESLSALEATPQCCRAAFKCNPPVKQARSGEPCLVCKVAGCKQLVGARDSKEIHHTMLADCQSVELC